MTNEGEGMVADRVIGIRVRACHSNLHLRLLRGLEECKNIYPSFPDTHMT